MSSVKVTITEWAFGPKFLYIVQDKASPLCNPMVDCLFPRVLNLNGKMFY